MDKELVNLHFIWLGSPLSEENKKLLEKWKSNPELNVILWDENSISELPQGLWHDRTLSPVIRSDILRVYVTWLYGGWYSDFSTYPGKNGLYNSEKYIFVRQDSTTLLNGFFYSPRGHAFGLYFLDSLQTSNLMEYSEIDYSSGPFALMRALYRYTQINPLQASKEIEYLPYGDHVSIPQSIVKKSLYPIKHGRLATDIGESSWNKIANIKKKHKFLRRLLFVLKRNTYLETVFRLNYILSHRPLREIIKVTRSPISLLENFVPRVLQIHELEICEVEHLEDFLSVVHQLNVVAVISKNKEVSNSIKSAGWLPCRVESIFLRPKITNYFSQQNQVG